MKLLTISSVIALLSTVYADVQYSVVAFPPTGANVAVSVNGQNHPLTADGKVPNLFKGTAPSGDKYQYVFTNGQNNTPETPLRTLKKDATSTGNEFFNRTYTVLDIPALPQAYHPVYPPLFSNFNKSNEVATIILQVNNTAFDAIIKDPKLKAKAQVNSFTYISNQEVYTINTTPAIETSGQSTKDFAKQSYSIDFNDATPKGGEKALFYGRTAIKLRAEPTDPTQVREKLYLDCLAAAGATTLSGSFVRLFVNNEPYGLYTLMDDISTHTIDNMIHGGDWANKETGVTYKGNALSPTQEGNLLYAGDDATKYSVDFYKVADSGEDPNVSKKNNTMGPLIDFTKRLSQINPSQLTDGNNQQINGLLNPQNTMVALAMNYLADSWDGLWFQASNYYLNQNIKTNQWTFISYDFDETFGNPYTQGRDTVAYTNYSRPGSQRPYVDLFLNSPHYKKEFETILQTLVKRFFKPSVIGPRLEAWSKLLKEDIEWDYSLPGRSPGTKNTYTVETFITNLNTTDSSIAGINEWVSNRVKSLTQQLNFNDQDDLPALGPYKGGSILDANGKVVPNDGSSVTPGGNAGNANGSKGTSNAMTLSSSSALLFGMMFIGTFYAL
ncbi:coth protein-domain-containing protein [Cunninghamella echinulata]|nr:coth protein-domain-containing protein [Cunninghamella echinulata]